MKIKLKPEDEPEFVAILTAFAEGLNFDIKKANLDSYFMYLDELSLQEIKRACYLLGKEVRYFPKPVEFIDMIKEDHSPKPQMFKEIEYKKEDMPTDEIIEISLKQIKEVFEDKNTQYEESITPPTENARKGQNLGSRLKTERCHECGRMFPITELVMDAETENNTAPVFRCWKCTELSRDVPILKTIWRDI
jgi:hypothetical protein